LTISIGKGSRVALEGALREQGGAIREHRGSIGEHRRAEREQKHEVGPSAGAIRRCRIFETRGYYIYYIYTPNLGLEITAFDREREQGRFRGRSEGAGGSSEGARGSTEGALKEHGGATVEYGGRRLFWLAVLRGRSKREPELAVSYPGVVKITIVNTV